MKKKPTLSKEEGTSKFLLERSIGIDKSDIESTELECTEYLRMALTHYLKTILLEQDDNNSAALFRVFSLWFSNKSDEKVLECLARLDQVASHKFLPMMPQIATRLSNENEPFSRKIEEIVCKYHSDLLVDILLLIFVRGLIDLIFFCSQMRHRPPVPHSPSNSSINECLQR